MTYRIIVGALVWISSWSAFALDTGDYRLVDLSHSYGENTLYWPDAMAYLGDDMPGHASKLQFPGYGEAASRILAEDRAVAMLGVDSASVELGQVAGFHRAQGGQCTRCRQSREPGKPRPATGNRCDDPCVADENRRWLGGSRQGSGARSQIVKVQKNALHFPWLQMR